ncbi:MAG: hypothetical protein SFY81_08330 [Verrucomicrobiota bacterium]|nr:hypothetical protein [Verrucomicrobiota bacterium]
MSDSNNWSVSSDRQKLSDRTVFRFQQLANLLKNDLTTLPHYRDSLHSVFFVQRDWKHSRADTGRYYKANLCATYQLVGGIRTELINALDAAGESSITRNQLEELFRAHAVVSGEGNRFEAFQKEFRSENEILRERAHSLLIQAASSIPYRGQLPTAFDEQLKLSANAVPNGYWFTGKGTEFTFRRLPRLNTETEEPLQILPNVHPVSFHTDIGASEELLNPLFRTFLNPLLRGDTPNKSSPAYAESSAVFSGFAFPCYEETRPDQFSGAFLGWLLFSFLSSDPPNDLGTHWNSFRFAVNHFADRVLEASIDEVLGEYGTWYAKAERPKPEVAFKSIYLARIEGWEFDDTATSELKLPRKSQKDHKTPLDFVITIKPKWDTLFKADIPISEALRLRCHRLHKGLNFVYDNSQIDELKKYEQMMQLLQRPLEELSRSIGTMQRDTQELRAILYDPARAIFESHKSLSGLFEENEFLQVSPDVRIKLNHNCSYKEPNCNDYGSQLDGRVVWALALCRIFGIEKERELSTCRSKESVVLTAKDLIAQYEKRDAFKELKADLIHLCAPDGRSAPESLSDSLNREDVTDFLVFLKWVVFKPFKVSEDKWHILPLLLALERYRLAPDDKKLTLPEGVENGPTIATWADIAAALTISREWTPVAWHAVLNYLLKSSAVAYKRNRITSIKVWPSHDSSPDGRFVIEVWFRDSYLYSQAGPLAEVERLRRLINDQVLSSPRDWRIESANIGDFYSPFVELASRIMGFVDSHPTGSNDNASPAGWRKPKSGLPHFDDHSPNTICILEQGTRQFRLELGHKASQPGIRLAWLPVDGTLVEGQIADNLEESKNASISRTLSASVTAEKTDGMTFHLRDHESGTKFWLNALKKLLPEGTILIEGNENNQTEPTAAKLSAPQSIVFLHCDSITQKPWVDAFSIENGIGHLVILSAGAPSSVLPNGAGERVHVCGFGLNAGATFTTSKRVTLFFQKLTGYSNLSDLPWGLLCPSPEDCLNAWKKTLDTESPPSEKWVKIKNRLLRCAKDLNMEPRRFVLERLMADRATGSDGDSQKRVFEALLTSDLPPIEQLVSSLEILSTYVKQSKSNT